jgi:hypothetical protein
MVDLLIWLRAWWKVRGTSVKFTVLALWSAPFNAARLVLLRKHNKESLD